MCGSALGSMVSHCRPHTMLLFALLLLIVWHARIVLLLLRHQTIVLAKVGCVLRGLAARHVPLLSWIDGSPTWRQAAVGTVDGDSLVCADKPLAGRDAGCHAGAGTAASCEAGK